MNVCFLMWIICRKMFFFDLIGHEYFHAECECYLFVFAKKGGTLLFFKLGTTFDWKTNASLSHDGCVEHTSRHVSHNSNGSLAVSLSTKRLTNETQIIKMMLETTYSKVSLISGASWVVCCVTSVKVPQTVSQNLSKRIRFHMFLSENCVVVGVKSFDLNISRLNIFVSFLCYTSGVYRISKPLNFLDLNKAEIYCWPYCAYFQFWSIVSSNKAV